MDSEYIGHAAKILERPTCEIKEYSKTHMPNHTRVSQASETHAQAVSPHLYIGIIHMFTGAVGFSQMHILESKY